MANVIDLTQEEMEALQDKLDNYKDSLSENEAKLLEALLGIAKEEMDKTEAALTGGPGWYFSWTYRF